MMGMDETIIDRIAFGGVKELEELSIGAAFRNSFLRPCSPLPYTFFHFLM
jgi:hypothetical protein